MASSYTSLLGLVLPVTGELSGNWGDVWNDSGTSLIDSAIAGTTTLSTDGDVTLSTTTGASNQARQAILLCSGARTALRTITAPAQSKIYTVINATTGGYSVKVVGAGPTTGVTIVAGESAVIAWNGSDFIKVSNTGGSASFTNVTVSGTTTLSGLTASTALALNSSKEVVSVTNTGTGNNVLSASPTLTGTLAAAAATFSGNVTLGDASTDTVTVNGYMGVGGAGNPGRGIQVVSTALTGGDQVGVYSNPTASSSATTALRSFQSLPKTAVAAFTCANIYGFSAEDASLGAGSSVTNLVGVQIADQTQGTNNYGLRSLVSSGTNKWNIYVSGTAANYFAGDVGVGTTTPSQALVVLRNTGASGLESGFSITNNVDSNLFLRVTGTGATDKLASIATTVATALTFSTNSTERLRITSAGNVGIGTSSPTNTLSVTGTANVTGNVTLGDATTDTVTVNGYMGVGGAASSSIGVYLRSSALGSVDQIGYQSALKGTSAATTFIRGFSAFVGTEAASFTVANLAGYSASDASKGAGSTITNQHGLYIADQTQGTNNYGITSLVSSGTNKWNIYASGTAANYFAGNVGIGTNAPSSRLDVADATSAIITLTRTDSTSGNGVIRSVGNTGVTNASINFGGGVNNNMVFTTNAAERMRISATGGLSIGTTTDPGAGGLITTGNTTLGDATTDTVTVNGYMAVGGAGGSAAGLWVRNTALTGTNQNGILVSPVGTTSGTSVAAIVTNPGTAASVYTATALYGMYVGDAVKGAGSTITTQNGITIADQTQGVSNIGLTSQVSSGSGKWNIYVTGTADNYFAGRVGFGTTSLGGASGQYRFSGSITGAVTSNGIYYTPTVQSDVTTTASIIVSQPSTAAASFTLTTLSHFLANQSTIGAGSTVTNQYGFNVANSLTGATNNYGFYGGIAAATGRWNLYMAGTAANYLAGPLTVAATGANGIDLNASSTDSARLFFSTSTAGQGWSMVNGGGIFRLSPAATAGGSTGLPVFTITQAGQFAFLPDTVTQSMTLTSTGVLLLGTTSATGSTVKLQVNSDAYINSLTVGKGTASLSANTALGVNALLAITTGNNNTAVGFGAGDAITTGASNIAIGPNALGAAQTVSNNIAIGATALLQATAGDNNVAIGGSAMTGAVTGGNNTAIGAAVMGANTSGADNTSVGYLSMSSNTTGSFNTALGRRALWGNTTTSNNVAVGYFALDDVLTGGNGTAVGFQALTAATGGNNTALGYSAGGTTTTGTQNLFLGYQAGNLITTGGKNVIIGSYQGNSGGLDIRTSSNYIVLSDGDANIRQVIDSSGNSQTIAGSSVVWAPAPASISTTATLTNANIQGQIINTTGTSYTVTMPLGSTLETLVPWATTDLGYNFTVINTASGTITMAVNTGVTSLGALTIATGTSANFRIRRTAANTFVLYRMS